MNPQQQECPDQDLMTEDDNYEIDYVKQRTGASTEEIKDAMKKVGKNWVNIIFYLKNQL